MGPNITSEDGRPKKIIGQARPRDQSGWDAREEFRDVITEDLVTIGSWKKSRSMNGWLPSMTTMRTCVSVRSIR